MVNQKKIKCINALVMVFLIAISFFLASKTVIIGDEIYHCFNSYSSPWDFLVNAHRGRYFAWIELKLFGYVLPKLAGIHFQENIFTWLMRAVNVVISCYILSSFAFIFNKKNLLMPFLIVISYIYLWVTTLGYHTYMLDVEHNVSYLFMTMFQLLFWMFTIEYIVNNKIPLRKHLFRNCAILFCLGISTEFCNISTLISVMLLALWFLLKNCFDNKWDVNKVFQKIKTIDINVYLPIIFLIFGMFLYFISPSFQQEMHSRTVSGENKLLSCIASLKGFWNEYYLTLFVENAQKFYIILSLAAILFFFSDDKIKVKKILTIILIIFLGIWVFYFTLIYSGRTFYDGVSFWVISIDLRIIYDRVFLAVIFLLYGSILAFCSKRKVLIGIISIALLVYSGGILVSNFDLYKKDYKNTIKEMQYRKTTMYIIEKMYLFYALQNKTAILPAELVTCKDKGFLCTYLTSDQPVVIGKKYTSPVWNIYFPPMHKGINLQEYYFINKKDAMNKFEKAGGVISKDELENPNFNKLLSKNFILKNTN